MAESPQIFLHVGAGKVASSTIQFFLRKNADEIRRQGLLIADVDFEFPATGPVRGYPLRIVEKWMSNSETGGRCLAEALEKGIEACRAGGFRGMIVSSEYFASPEAAGWFAESAGHLSPSVKAILYLRRLDRWLESAWKQWVMMKGELGLTAFVETTLKTGYPNFLSLARGWKAAAGHLTVRPVEAIDDIQAHFAEWCGLDFSQLVPAETSNRMPDWALLDLLSRNASLFGEINENRLFGFLERYLTEVVPRDDHGLMPAEQARTVLDSVESDNRKLREEFFPELPECEWDHPQVDEAKRGRVEAFGSIDSIYRILALQLILSLRIHQRFGESESGLGELAGLAEQSDRLADSVTRRFDRLRARLDRETQRRRELEQRLRNLESRSLRRKFARLFRKLGARFRRNPEPPISETADAERNAP